MSEYSDKIKALPPEYVAKWEDLCDRVNAMLKEVFPGEDERFGLVLGVQFGDMGKEGHPELPVCLATTNLPLCYGAMAAQDAMEFLDEQHAEFHGEGGANGVVTEPMNPDAVPDAIRAQAEAYAAEHGLSVDQIKYVAVGQALDVPDSPEDEEIEG